MAEEYKWNQEDARALVEAGYLSLPEYLRLCRENGWAPKDDERGPNRGSTRPVLAAPSNITFAASRRPKRQNITG